MKIYNKPGAIIIEGHVQGLSNTRALGEQGIPIYVVDKNNCIAQYSKYCKKFFKCPDFTLDKFADFLIELAVNEKILDWVLIPSNDHAVYTISKHKARLEKHYKVITPGLGIIEKIYDKAKLIEIARQVNVPVPITQLFTSEDEELKREMHYPIITKGRNGLSFYKALGKKVLLANDDKELRKQLALIRERYSVDGTFTQELIPFNGNNYTASFTAFCINGEIKAHWSGVKVREHPIRFGTATFAKSVYIESCHKQSIPLLKALNYTGVCEVEYIQDPRDGKYKLIEINPRTWLWVGLAKKCGLDYAKLIYDYVNDYQMIYSQVDLNEKYWLNPITDTAYSIFNLFRVRLNFFTYIFSLFNKHKVNALFVKGDMKPGWLYLFKMSSFLRQR